MGSGDRDAGLVAKSCATLATAWTVARQAPLSMGFSRQECWSGLPFPLNRSYATCLLVTSNELLKHFLPQFSHL